MSFTATSYKTTTAIKNQILHVIEPAPFMTITSVLSIKLPTTSSPISSPTMTTSPPLSWKTPTTECDAPEHSLIQQIKDCQEYAEDAHQSCTIKQLIHIGYNLIFVFKTSLYFNDCKKWTAHPANKHTWEHFKAHFARQFSCRRRKG